MEKVIEFAYGWLIMSAMVLVIFLTVYIRRVLEGRNKPLTAVAVALVWGSAGAMVLVSGFLARRLLNG